MVVVDRFVLPEMVVLADGPEHQKPERRYKNRNEGTKQMFLDPEIRNEGTKQRNDGTTNRNEGTFAKTVLFEKKRSSVSS